MAARTRRMAPEDSRLRHTQDVHNDMTYDSKKTDFTELKGKTSAYAQIRESSHTNSEPSPGSTRSALLILALVFLGALGALGSVYCNFPQLEENELQYIRLPRNIEDAKNLGQLLHRYRDRYFYQVLLAYFVVFIFLQTFAIPGSIFLSIISGFLYPFLLALPLVCLCSALGASFCYLLSYMVGRRIIQKYFPQRTANWKKHVDNHREHLFNYMLFLRITPFLPNWFINITSPVIDVPLSIFFLGTAIGVAPPSFVFIQAGTTLNKLTSTSEAWSWANVGLLVVFAVLAVLPVLFKKQLRARLD